MRTTKHNLIAQPYALQVFRVHGIIQCWIAGNWSETPVTETVRVERIGEAADKALRQIETAMRRLDPLAIVRWHTPEWVQAEIAQ